MTATNKKVLIIDDDPRNVFALSAVLRSRGYVCVAAGSGQDGLAMLADKSIGIILIDMMMPEMDGYTVIPLIKSNGQSEDIPVIAITAQAMPGDKEKCLWAGADDYLSKPVDIDKLIALLSRFLK